VRKLKIFLPALVVIAMLSTTGCKKTTTNNTVVKDSVYYSAWLPLSTQMTIDPSSGDTFYTQQISAPAITASVISKGAVIGYYGYPTSGGDTLMFDEAEFGSFAEMSVTTGNIEIDAASDLTYTNNGYLFRYVIIPGNVLVTSFNGLTQQQLHRLSFSDVQKAVNTAKQSSGNTFTP
jgi:hypothetical protein